MWLVEIYDFSMTRSLSILFLLQYTIPLGAVCGAVLAGLLHDDPDDNFDVCMGTFMFVSFAILIIPVVVLLSPALILVGIVQGIKWITILTIRTLERNKK